MTQQPDMGSTWEVPVYGPFSPPPYEGPVWPPGPGFFDPSPNSEKNPMTEPELAAAVEQQPATDPTYEQFYPTDPYPAMSDEDKAAYEQFYPNINKETNR